jgi:hypothetical protein
VSGAKFVSAAKPWPRLPIGIASVLYSVLRQKESFSVSSDRLETERAVTGAIANHQVEAIPLCSEFSIRVQEREPTLVRVLCLEGLLSFCAGSSWLTHWQEWLRDQASAEIAVRGALQLPRPTPKRPIDFVRQCGLKAKLEASTSK